MDRRAFLHTSIVGALAGHVLGDATLARAQQPAPAAGQAPTSAPAPTPRRLVIDAYSRHLHWLRTPDEIAEAAIEMTCGGVMPTVQPHPGHVNPENVVTELPAFVQVMQKHGLRVKQIRGGGATDASEPNVEALVGTMGDLGVTHYWLGTDRYDLTQPILPQLDAIKRKVERFVKLNEQHGTTLMYHTRAGASSVGGVVWDLLYVMKDFDPRYVAFHWDTGHMAHHGAMWETLFRTAGPYIAAIGWKDRTWHQDVGGLDDQGGPFPGPPQYAAAAAEEAGGGRGGGRGGRGGGRGGRGRGAPQAFPLPLAGELFARGGGWSSPYVPMGTGLVDIFAYATAMRDIGFDGPMELQVEYPLGGADRGSEEITRPRIEVLGMMKRDVLTIRAAFEQSGTGLSI